MLSMSVSIKDSDNCMGSLKKKNQILARISPLHFHALFAKVWGHDWVLYALQTGSDLERVSYNSVEGDLCWQGGVIILCSNLILCKFYLLLYDFIQ